jgi:hypothetical protein
MFCSPFVCRNLAQVVRKRRSNSMLTIPKSQKKKKEKKSLDRKRCCTGNPFATLVAQAAFCTATAKYRGTSFGNQAESMTETMCA